jgi:hypothetical protein
MSILALLFYGTKLANLIYTRGVTNKKRYMKNLILFSLVFYSTRSHQTWAQDALLQKNLMMQTTQFEAVLNRTENNIKAFVDNFTVKLGGAKLTSPQVVSGTIMQPVLKMSVKKCVFVICQTIDFDAEFSLQKGPGACTLNYILVGDLRRSSEGLAKLYTNMNTGICIQKTPQGATASLNVGLIRASTYSGSSVQKEIMKVMKNQADGIIESFSKVMIQNGVTAIN